MQAYWMLLIAVAGQVGEPTPTGPPPLAPASELQPADLSERTNPIRGGSGDSLGPAAAAPPRMSRPIDEGSPSSREPRLQPLRPESTPSSTPIGESGVRDLGSGERFQPLTARPAAAVERAGPAPTPMSHRADEPRSRTQSPLERRVAAVLAPPEGELAIAGEPLTLAAALDRRGVSEPLAIVHQYWRLSESLARYHLAVEEQRQAASLRVARDPGEEARQAAAAAEAAADLAAAKQRVLRAQFQLATLLSIDPSDPPLPADHPLAGAYSTRFNELFPAGAAPARVRHLAATIPLAFQRVRLETEAVDAMGEVAALNRQEHRQGRLSVAAVVDSDRQLAARRRAWVEAVYQYNHEIADYALEATGQAYPTRTLLTMLLKTPEDGMRSVLRRREDSAVVPATALEPTIAPLR